MKYMYNSLFLFMIMLSVIWFGAGSSASAVAAGPNPNAHPEANVEHCSLRQSDTGFGSPRVTRDE